MFETVQEITTVVDEKEQDLSALRAQMTGDWELYTLAPFVADKGYESFTSNRPRTYFDKILDGVNRAVISQRIELPEKVSKVKREKAEQGELYLYGAINAINRRQVDRGEPPLRESLAALICARGWVALRALVYLPKRKEHIVFDVVPWDPMHMTWEQGTNGLIWAALTMVKSKAQIQSEYDGYTINGKQALVKDFYDAERNSVIVDGSFIKTPTAHNIGHVPVIITAVGSMPTMQPQYPTTGISVTNTAILARGDSVWAASRHLYEPQNRYTSWIMDLAKRTIHNPMVHSRVSGSEIKLEMGALATDFIIPLEIGETLKPLEMAPLTPEIPAVLGIIGTDIEQGTLPYPLAHGGTEGKESGRALAIRLDTTRSVYSPRMEALARVYRWLMEQLLVQFATKGAKATTMQGYKPASGGGHDVYFEVTTKPSGIDKSWHVTVTVEPVLPRDEEAEIAMALAATSKRSPEDEPLISVLTARRDILKLPDPDAEEDRVLVEKGKNLPPILAANVAKALKEAGEPELAEQVLQLLTPQQAAPPAGAPGPVPAPSGPAGPQPQAPQPGQPQPGQEPPQEVQVIMAVVEALQQAGAQDLATALIASLEADTPIPPQLIAAIIEVLRSAGLDDLAQAFVAVIEATTSPGPAAAPAPGQQPPPTV